MTAVPWWVRPLAVGGALGACAAALAAAIVDRLTRRSNP